MGRWDSETFKAILDLESEDYCDYLQQPYEAFSRAYSQYIAWRSRDAGMLAQLRQVLHSDDLHARVTRWDYAEFAPIAEAMDELLGAQGLLSR